ncbi:MAG: ABC transporter substrate-binding protein, partial [Gammaproteobacteria bacterium]|nr:ABC transporter substrate-binding protein [Gammaproteobacteria bacterium]
MFISSTFNKINRILFFPLVLFLLLSTAVFAEAVTDSGSSTRNQEKVTIQLKWYHQFQFAGYYAAIEKGFYAEEGLQVELRQRVAGT